MSTSIAKPRYELLDGLRGVAAVMVLWYHVFEAFATSPVDQMVNHGYLAVDFFFMLSGFVVAYAYDDRWVSSSSSSFRLTIGGFIKRRLIRLHPMLVLGMVFGAVAYVIQGCVKWDGSMVPLWHVALALLLSCVLLPAWPGSLHEVRGNGEMFPLNGPSWSLFFEYVANLLYALVLRRLNTRSLTAVVVVSGGALAAFSVCDMSGAYHLGVGWSLGDWNFPGGMLRVLFGFSAGMLMERKFKAAKVRGAFWVCTIMLVVLLSMPFAGNDGAMWLNGLYDAVCVILVFPVILYIGASGTTTDRRSTSICDFLGKISYPVYVVHYPLMYLFYAWVWGHGLSFGQSWPVAVSVIAASLLLAWVCLKFYDEPVRRYLSRVAQRR